MADVIFSIKNRYIFELGMWLQGLTLEGRESRERTKFVMQLEDQVRINEKARLAILDDYADKEEDGKTLKLIEEGGQKNYNIPDDKLEAFKKEMNEYFDQEFVIEGPGNSERLKRVKAIVLDTTEKINPQIAIDYDKWCEAFEKVEI